MRAKVKLPKAFTMGALPARFSLITSEAQWKKLFRYLQVEPRCEWLSGCAMTSMIEPEAGERPHILVCYQPKEWPDSDTPETRIDEAALMAHEAAHVVQRVFDFMHEEAPGEEVRAYAIQHVTGLLLSELWGE